MQQDAVNSQWPVILHGVKGSRRNRIVVRERSKCSLARHDSDSGRGHRRVAIERPPNSAGVPDEDFVRHSEAIVIDCPAVVPRILAAWRAPERGIRGDVVIGRKCLNHVVDHQHPNCQLLRKKSCGIDRVGHHIHPDVRFDAIAVAEGLGVHGPIFFSHREIVVVACKCSVPKQLWGDLMWS